MLANHSTAEDLESNFQKSDEEASKLGTIVATFHWVQGTLARVVAVLKSLGLILDQNTGERSDLREPYHDPNVFAIISVKRSP